MSAPPKFSTRAEAVAAFNRGACRRWVNVDGWQVDLLAPEPRKEAPPEPSVSDALRPLAIAWPALTVDERRELVEIAREAMAEAMRRQEAQP